MENNIDGDYIVARDWDHAVNGQKLGLRSLLKIKRLKPEFNSKSIVGSQPEF